MRIRRRKTMLTVKYRPHTLNEMVGQEKSVELIRSQSIKDEWFPVQLLYGQYGGGKTTMARIIALSANCEHKDENGNPCLKCEACKSILAGTSPDVIEIAAAVYNGVDDIRELNNSANFKPVGLKYKVYIIDEVHMLSKGAFNALLKLLETPPENTMFILCTTEKNMILDTIQSRTAPYSFTSIPKELIKKHVLHVAELENFKVSDDAAAVIAKRAQGSLRTALMLLEMATKETGEATGESIEKMLGISAPSEVFDVIRAIVTGDKAGLVKKMVALNSCGASVHELLTDLSETMTELTLASIFPEALFGSDTYVAMAEEILRLGTTETFQTVAEGLIDLKGKLPKDFRGQDLVIKLLGILNKNNESAPVLSKEFVLLKKEIEELKKGTVLPGAESGSFCNYDGQYEREVIVQSVAEVLPVNNDVAPEGFEKADAENIPFAEPVKEELAAAPVEEPAVTAPAVSVPPAQTSADWEEDDMFSFLMGEEDTPDCPIVTNNEETVSDEMPENTYSSDLLVIEELKEDPAFYSAFSMCSVEQAAGKTVISTPFDQVKKFVSAYFLAYSVRYTEDAVKNISVIMENRS